MAIISKVTETITGVTPEACPEFWKLLGSNVAALGLKGAVLADHYADQRPSFQPPRNPVDKQAFTVGGIGPQPATANDRIWLQQPSATALNLNFPSDTSRSCTIVIAVDIISTQLTSNKLQVLAVRDRANNDMFVGLNSSNQLFVSFADGETATHGSALVAGRHLIAITYSDPNPDAAATRTGKLYYDSLASPLLTRTLTAIPGADIRWYIGANSDTFRWLGRIRAVATFDSDLSLDPVKWALFGKVFDAMKTDLGLS